MSQRQAREVSIQARTDLLEVERRKAVLCGVGLPLVILAILLVLATACSIIGANILLQPDLRADVKKLYNDAIEVWAADGQIEFASAIKSESLRAYIGSPLYPLSVKTDSGSYPPEALLQGTYSYGPASYALGGTSEQNLTVETESVNTTIDYSGYSYFIQTRGRLSDRSECEYEQGGRWVDQLYVDVPNCYWLYRLTSFCTLLNPTSLEPTAPCFDHPFFKGDSPSSSLPRSPSPALYRLLPSLSHSTEIEPFDITFELRSRTDPFIYLQNLLFTVYSASSLDDLSTLSTFELGGAIGLLVLGLICFFGFLGFCLWGTIAAGKVLFTPSASPTEPVHQELREVRVHVNTISEHESEDRSRSRSRSGPFVPFRSSYVPRVWSGDDMCETFTIKRSGIGTQRRRCDDDSLDTVPLYIVSDFHLRGESNETQLLSRFQRLCSKIISSFPPSSSSSTTSSSSHIPQAYLILLGDIVDEWAQDHNILPVPFEDLISQPPISSFFELLSSYARNYGLCSIYVKGNHDMELRGRDLVPYEGVYYGGERLLVGDIILEHGHRFDMLHSTRFGDFHVIEDITQRFAKTTRPVGYFIERMKTRKRVYDRRPVLHPLRIIFEQLLHQHHQSSSSDRFPSLTEALDSLQRVSLLRLFSSLSNRGVGLRDSICVGRETRIPIQALFEQVGQVGPLFHNTMLSDIAKDPNGVPVIIANSTLKPFFSKLRYPRLVQEEMKSGLLAGLGSLASVPKRFSPHFRVVVFAHTHVPSIKLLKDDQDQTFLYANAGHCQEFDPENWTVLKVSHDLNSSSSSDELLSGCVVELFTFDPDNENDNDPTFGRPVALGSHQPQLATWKHGSGEDGVYHLEYESNVNDPASLSTFYVKHRGGVQGTCQCPGHVVGHDDDVLLCSRAPKRIGTKSNIPEDEEGVNRLFSWENEGMRESLREVKSLFPEFYSRSGRRGRSSEVEEEGEMASEIGIWTDVERV